MKEHDWCGVFFSSKKQLSILITHFLTAVILLSVDTSRQWATVSSWILQECRLDFFEKGMLSARIDLQANGERRRVAPLLCLLKERKRTLQLKIESVFSFMLLWSCFLPSSFFLLFFAMLYHSAISASSSSITSSYRTLSLFLKHV